jgi:hypothetical protein
VLIPAAAQAADVDVLFRQVDTDGYGVLADGERAEGVDRLLEQHAQPLGLGGLFLA